MCALAGLAAACSSGDAIAARGTAPGDGGTSDSAPANIASDSGLAAPDSGPADGAPDSGPSKDASAPAAPSCNAGDRQEWSGAIPNTLLAVAVCSLCGESYIVASNGSASPGVVSAGNGSTTITANVPPGGTATTANIADDPTSGSVNICGDTGSHQCLPAATPNQRYCNPYRDVAGLTPERIDQGVDYGGSGSIYALGPGTIDLFSNRNDPGWPGSTFVSYKVSAGPASGKIIYLAENIDLDPALHAGSFVYSGTVLGTLVHASPDSESGWGVEGAGYTAEHSCYTEGCMTALGVNFNELLVCLKAPSGTTGQGGCCTSAAGWPSGWCSLLAAWQ